MGKKLGNLIRTARTDAGLTQASLAAQIDGVSASDIGRYERAEAEPTQQVVKAIAKACGVTQKSLLDAMPKTGTRTSTSSRTTSSSASTSSRTSATTGKTSSSSSSSSGTSVKLSATEKRLVELYRAADSTTRKRALAVLKGEETQEDQPVMDELLSNLGGLLGQGDLSSVLGNSDLASMLGDAIFKR